MKSTRANLRLDGQTLLLSGMGYGHGVGMGQWDAQGMALQGRRYQDILSYFYPGTRAERVW
jgi:stage II sporulation protein D